MKLYRFIKTRLKKFGLPVLGILFLSGCASTHIPSVSARDVSGTFCAPFTQGNVTRSSSLPSEISSYPSPSNPPVGLSPKSWQMAQIIGITPIIKEIQSLEASEQPLQLETRQRLLELRQSFSETMMTAFFEVNSVAGQIDCEAVRANHVANTLSEIRDRRAQRYEIIAIVGDALVGVAGGALALGVNETASAIADIVGGNVAVGFGLAAGLTEEEREFRDPQNLLRELWEVPPKPTVFPETVWRYLNWHLAEPSEFPTIRQELIAEWQDDGYIAKADIKDRRISLLFGSGGVYEIEDLRAKAQMLEELKTYVDAMVHQLHLLSQEFLNARQQGTSQKSS